MKIDKWFHLYGRKDDIVFEEVPFEQLPSAETEIIHCKDCKNWDTTWHNDWLKNHHYCAIIDGARHANWYCADAERREE